ncbi:ABC transporter ATP-binding protein [Priestia megaterium]|uniref:ABC transporter ATP-binding protein n=1 Tax=Priestia megaterium TaxID=1404 RepID=UPI00112EE3CC|nr:oligopeptide/dipeptide ABC transporter ATP-binding protein [Priestia megaterium]TPF18406.1 peptide ABC transporter ATP-binding protein [Priestia megaterium]TPF22516.1 peptide ABC transporter ATP-binding protein [Priestia megaterium]
MNEVNNELIEIRDLKKYFPAKSSFLKKKNQVIKAVDGISLTIYKGETFGLVGESGCGKSTLGRTICRLYNPTSGKVLFEGDSIEGLTYKELKPYQKKIQAVFQDPFSSLNPNMTVGDIIDEPLDIHTTLSRKERKERVKELLEKVGLKKEDINKFPYEFSGGQRQRIGIARALSTNPEFILCDEAISALDVSIQAQIINMLEELQEEFGLTYLFITHDLSMVRHISNRIGVMYLGKIVEIAPSKTLYEEPLHPYTKALLSAIPVPDPNYKIDVSHTLQGEIPSPLEIGIGCRFQSRCPLVTEYCMTNEPALKEVNDNHFVACHLVDE